MLTCLNVSEITLLPLLPYSEPGQVAVFPQPPVRLVTAAAMDLSRSAVTVKGEYVEEEEPKLECPDPLPLPCPLLSLSQMCPSG